MSQNGRWFAVGHSNHREARKAGVAATEQALERDDPKLAVVFCSDRYDLTQLLGAVNQTTGGVPLIGCSTAGEIATAGPKDASVVVTVLGGEGFSATTSAASAASGGLRGAGAEAASCTDDLRDHPYRVLVLLTDGLVGDQSEIVRGAYGQVGAGVPLVGGCAGDDLKMNTTYQLHGDEVLEKSVVAAAIGSDAPLGIGVRHGWRRVGEPMLITGGANNRVFTIDELPALDVYLERLDAPAEVRTDPGAFTRFALTHPLGLAARGGEEQVRFVGDANLEDRSIGCIAEVPQGGLAWLMEGDDASVLSATDAACADALAPLEGRPPLGLIAFDCIARRGVLGDEGIRIEVEHVVGKGRGAPVAGFYTYGEIARTKGITGFHNQTLVVLALG